MDTTYCIERAGKEDMPAVFALINGRMQWMRERGLHQWDAVEYWNIYPEAHYHALREAGQLYVLRDARDGRVVCAAALLERDERWDACPDRDEPAYYVHHFASDAGVRGAGSVMLEKIEQLARENGKTHVRLDCMVDNAPLNAYYQSRGYLPRGEFGEGGYRGLRREKRVVA